MSLLEVTLLEGRSWSRVGDAYEVTRKPRRFDLSPYADVPFLPMEAVPQSGAFQPVIPLKSRADIASGTYFERGDLLIAKITPSFENGKQALVRDLALPFGYATTEVIPLRRRSSGHDPRLLFFYLLHPDVRHHIAERMEGSTGRQRVPESVLLDLPIPAFDDYEEQAIGNALETVQTAALSEEASLKAAMELKRAALSEMFRAGLRGEAQRESEIGLVPRSWTVELLSRCATVVSTRMSLAELRATEECTEETVDVLGIKVADMNRAANETDLQSAALSRRVSLRVAQKRCAPPQTIIFPKRGAAIATNKKRLSTTWTAFDPNVIGVVARSCTDVRYLFHWFQFFDLRSITQPGPTPQLNKKDLEPVLVPLPPTLGEQREIATVLDAIDAKIDLHRCKRAVLDDLFRTLLHRLMTGEISVGDLDLTALKPPARECAP